MILFLSDGRLGNQLYQAAFLQSIAKKNESIYCFRMNQFVDSFTIKDPYFHCYKLSHAGFLIFTKVIRRFLLNPLMACRIIGFVYQNQADGFFLPSHSVKKGLLPIFLAETHFYQSGKFFQLDRLKFELKKKFVLEAKLLLAKFNEYDLVFIHIRRGDYSQHFYSEKHPIMLPLSYYKRGIELMKSIVANPMFVFLSDEPQFVEDNFGELENKFISKQSMQVDLAIMSLCLYGVISNSSFSAWGAYLMKDRKKIIAPKYWFGWKVKEESHPGIQPPFAELIEVE